MGMRKYRCDNGMTGELKTRNEKKNEIHTSLRTTKKRQNKGRRRRRRIHKQKIK